jgi:hypothetical protein
MVAVLLSTLALAMYWQAKRVVTPEQSIYRPAERIAQVLAAGAALRAGDLEQEPAASLPAPAPALSPWGTTDAPPSSPNAAGR